MRLGTMDEAEKEHETTAEAIREAIKDCDAVFVVTADYDPMSHDVEGTIAMTTTPEYGPQVHMALGEHVLRMASEQSDEKLERAEQLIGSDGQPRGSDDDPVDPMFA